MFNNIIYILATSSLLTGSILTFNKDNIPDYFYLCGTSLFFLKSSLCLIQECKKNKKNNNIYDTI